MANYFLILLWPAVVSFFANLFDAKELYRINGSDQVRYKRFCAFIAAIPFIFFAANRGNIGDTTAYQYSFSMMPDSMSEIPAYMDKITKDELFYFSSAVIKALITSDPKVYFGILAAFQIFVLVAVYRKYSESFFLSLFLFIVSSDYLSWMFNGIRQFTAVCLTFICFTLILKKRYLPAIIIIIFASLFHGSALIVIPFIFIAQGKAWNKKTILFILAVLVSVAFVDQFTDVLDTVLTDTQYTNVVSDMREWNDDGTNFLRVMVYSVPAIISLIGKKKITQTNDKVVNLCTNMSIISAGIYVVSLFTSGILIGRLPIYFSLYSYILLPWELKHVFSPNNAKIVYAAMVFLYIIFYFFNLRYSFGLI